MIQSRWRIFPRHTLGWIGVLVAAVASAGATEPAITEFMAANTATLPDEDGAFSDWIEIHNPDASPINLAGWYLTDTATAKTKWQFPAVTVPGDGYLVVWASNKNRRLPGSPLHTNFALSAGGEYLGLIKPDGTTVVSEYAPTFPPQSNDISYGRLAAAGGETFEVGYFRQPTPGKANGEFMLLATVTLSRPAGPFPDSFALQLGGAGAGEHIRYVLAAPSPLGAAIPEPDITSAEYRAPIPITRSVILRAGVFSDDDARRGRPTTAHYLKIGPDLAGFTSQLPVLILDNHGFGPLEKDGVDHPSWLYTYGAGNSGSPGFARPPDLATPLTSTVRGSSSASFPKKSYNLKLTDSFGSKRAQSLLGSAYAYEKWALVGPWTYDHTYLHNAFIYALSNRLGRWAPRTQFAEVFYNSAGDDLGQTDYAGIYILTDRIEINEGRLALASLSLSDTTAPAVTGGYILKIDLQDADEYGWTTDHGIPRSNETSVVLAYPKAADLAPAQRDYIRGYVQHMENALYADFDSHWLTRTYLDYVDLSSWVDHHLLNTFASNLDALERSAYFTKDRGGKLVAGPLWDFDRAFGSADPRGMRWDVWFNEDSSDVWNSGWWGLLVRDPEFMQDWIDRWQGLRTGELATAKLTALADALAASIGPAAAARDTARWPDNASRYSNGYAGEVDALKSWLTNRSQWIDQQFLAAPTLTASGPTLTFTPAPGAHLAYTLDGSDPRSLGGAVAPNTQITSAPLSVPAATNVHVRCYRTDVAATVPGSPWSSAVGGPRSSPLSPSSKLINVSSRAFVGSGQSTLVAGLMVADTEGKSFLTRAVGPTLRSFGVDNAVPDPVLGLYRADGAELASNRRWGDSPDAAQLPGLAASVGAFPLVGGSHDAAIVSRLSAGSYIVQVTSEAVQPGVALVEHFALDENGRAVLASTRAAVRAPNGELIGGFVVRGPASKRMLIRAVGPTLASFGITAALADPVLTLFSGPNVVSSSDDWSSSPSAAVIAAATQAVGTFPLPAGSKDAALFITVAPGAYTVEVSGKNGAEGTALLEIYEVP